MRRFFLSVILLIPFPALAHPVITEVLWAGSDVSTTDEWVEISNPDIEDVSLAGMSLTSVNTKGEHVAAFRFGTGVTLPAGASVIVARKSATASRLLLEPGFISSTLTLPNTGLLLRLVDASGLVIDAVDDGAGAPFAGANPSGSGAKASMERIDPLASGTLKENWVTAVRASGIDEGAAVLATPGTFALSHEDPAAVCNDPLRISIAVQSGPLTGVGKVTLNLQAVAELGTLPSDACRWDFGDGFTSTSCNPPVHTFTLAGTYAVRLEATNTCGEILRSTQQIQVLPDGSLASSQAPYDDGAALALASALPNPEGPDTGHEWIAIRNPEELPVSLVGWRLRIGKSSYRYVNLKGSIDPHAVLRVYDAEQKLSLPNTETEVVLLSPAGIERSSMRWNTAQEGREFYPEDLRSLPVRGRVIRIIGSTVMEVSLEPDAARKNGDDHVFVKLIGIIGIPLADAEKTAQRLQDFSDRVRGKTVDLEFDEELWDSMGRLLAYVYTDEQLSLQEQLLVTADWMVDRSLDFRMRSLFLTRESPEIVAYIKQDDVKISGAFTEEKVAPVLPLDAQEIPHVFLTEIFASPDPKRVGVSGSLLSQEWLEIGTNEDSPQNLSGLILQSGSSKKRLSSGLEVSSGSRLVISLTPLHLPLRNAGSTVSILTPSGTVIDTVSYPKLAYGTSYSFDGLSWCVTLQPTPGFPNECKDVQAQMQKKKTMRKASAISPAVRKYAASYRANLADSTSEQYSLGSSVGFSGVSLLVAFLVGASLSMCMVVILPLLKRKFETLHVI